MVGVVQAGIGGRAVLAGPGLEELRVSGDVLYEVRDDVAWITLNRPDLLNAFDAEMITELGDAVGRAAEAGVVVITGAGRAFCAGGYLANLADANEDSIRALYTGTLRAAEAIRRCPRPVIAAVNGPAFGGGNELVVMCDLAIASDTASFGQTGPRIGSAAVLGGTNLLAISIGEKRAKEVSFMCRNYSADVALSLGWINAVVPPERLLEEVSSWAEELLEKSPRYLEISKISANVWFNECYDAMLGGLGALTQTIGSYDMLEGATAFLEKRKPRFRSAKG
jgi:2-ketocyclohexanecarboxyl-CoA hydrolase